jgi:hypothetical protein
VAFGYEYWMVYLPEYAVEPAKRLFALMRERFGVDMRLAVWDGDLTTIREL